MLRVRFWMREASPRIWEGGRSRADMTRRSEIEALLTVPQVAEICRVSTKTVRRWLERQELVGLRLGRQWRIRPRDLEAFLRARAWR
jgi:excisionase family DNA binding protein